MLFHIPKLAPQFDRLGFCGSIFISDFDLPENIKETIGALCRDLGIPKIVLFGGACRNATLNITINDLDLRYPTNNWKEMRSIETFMKKIGDQSKFEYRGMPIHFQALFMCDDSLRDCAKGISSSFVTMDTISSLACIINDRGEIEETWGHPMAIPHLKTTTYCQHLTQGTADGDERWHKLSKQINGLTDIDCLPGN